MDSKTRDAFQKVLTDHAGTQGCTQCGGDIDTDFLMVKPVSSIVGLGPTVYLCMDCGMPIINKILKKAMKRIPDVLGEVLSEIAGFGLHE